MLELLVSVIVAAFLFAMVRHERRCSTHSRMGRHVQSLWSRSAACLEIASQDANPVLAMLHAAEAVHLLRALQRLVSESEFAELCEVGGKGCISERVDAAQNLLWQRMQALNCRNLPGRAVIQEL